MEPIKIKTWTQKGKTSNKLTLLFVKLNVHKLNLEQEWELYGKELKFLGSVFWKMLTYMHFCICGFLENLLLALFYAKLTIYELWTVFNNFMTFFAKNVRLLGGHVGGGNRVWGFGHRSNKYLLGWFIPLSLTLMMQSGLGQSLILN